ncbi:hypothetical protein [Bacillus thuringiensis]|uniref:hypothetical protein n=1 Tax=Bacillus thuringiensis TaxID=1428 RepID=UPI0021D66098|nr:hypothetical protein [Bacillus thuringiensis]MCU7668201.1 hypothetical protein [Bacillus thuringiensis]
MTTFIDFVPILNVPKEVIQMWQGKELGTSRPYDSSDYVMGIVTLATGGTVKTIGKIAMIKRLDDIQFLEEVELWSEYICNSIFLFLTSFLQFNIDTRSLQRL